MSKQKSGWQEIIEALGFFAIIWMILYLIGKQVVIQKEMAIRIMNLEEQCEVEDD